MNETAIGRQGSKSEVQSIDVPAVEASQEGAATESVVASCRWRGLKGQTAMEGATVTQCRSHAVGYRTASRDRYCVS